MNKIITKHYELINAKYKLNPIEIKIVLTLISLIDKADKDFFTYQIPLSTFKFLTKDKNHNLLRSSCRSLMSKPLEVFTNDEWTIFNWFSAIKYSKKDNSIYCRFDKDLKPYLLQLKKNFKSYDLSYILTLSSFYSIRIYELLKQYEKIGSRTFNLIDLCEILSTPKSLNIYGNFKRKVLDIAQRDLISNTDIYFSYETIKTGKKITDIKFNIYSNIDTLDFFISYIRKNFVNLVLVEYSNGDILSCDASGYLYFKNKPDYRLNKVQSKKLWKHLYENKVDLNLFRQI